VPAPPAIEVRGLGKSFQGRRACWDLTFEVARGEVFGLLGPNGAGKTTTLRILAGLYAPDEGWAKVAGFDLTAGHSGSAELRRRVGLLTETPGFYDRLTARENLVHFAQLYGVGPGEAAVRGRGLLERFGLSTHADRPFAELSRGMKQKLAIARALIHEPEVIFLDEPTVGLDPEATREVRRCIAQLSQERRTIVLCTHDLDEVERLCSRAAFIAGRLLAVHDVAALSGPGRRVRIELARDFGPGLSALALENPGVASARNEGLSLVLELRDPGCMPDLVAALVHRGARIAAIVPQRDPLEEAYLELLAQARSLGLAA